MAHYAWINADNVVVNVTVGVDETVTQQGVGGSSEAWEQFYTQAINQEGVYIKRTSYNATNGYRKQFAGIGYTYDADADEFVASQPFPSWTLDDNNDWQPPTPKPEGDYYWNEAEQEWIEVV
jgi:hypothetical protein